MTEVIMPKMGDGMEEGTLLEWLKKEGDVVKPGDVLGTIQTDKATLELEAPGAGKLTGFLIKNGETVPVGKPIAALLKDGENLPQSWGSGAQPKEVTPVAESKPSPVEAPAPTNGEASVVQPAEGAPQTSEGRPPKASPLARRIASERGIDLTSLKGSGPGGRIVERDVLAAKPGAIAVQPVSTGRDESVELNRLRQLTAQ